MNKYKPHPYLFISIYLPFMAIITLAFCFHTHELASGMAVHWVFVPIFLLLIFLPQNNITCRQYNAKPFPPLVWLSALLSFHLSLSFLFTGFAKTIHASPHPFHIFPFDFFLLFAASMAIAIAQKKKGLLSSALTKWFNNSHEDKIGVMSDSYARFPSMISFSLTFTVMMLIIIKNACHYFHIDLAYGTYLNNIISLTVILAVTSSDKFRKIFRTLVTTFPLVIVVFVTIIALVSFIFLLNFILPHQNLNIHFLDAWNTADAANLLSSMFQLSWGLVYAGYILHVSQGYSLRLTLLASFAMAFFSLHFSQQLPWPTLSIATMLSAFYLMVLFVRRKTITHIARATLPGDKTFKQRAPFSYMQALITFFALFVVSYLTFGVPLLSYLAFITVAPAFYLMAFAIVSLFFSR